MITPRGDAGLGPLGFSASESDFGPSFGDVAGNSAILPQAFWGLCLTFNAGFTLLIVLKLYRMRSRVCTALGKSYGKMYTGIAAMLLESALLYTIVVVVAYVKLPSAGGTYNLFSPLATQTEVCRPL